MAPDSLSYVYLSLFYWEQGGKDNGHDNGGQYRFSVGARFVPIRQSIGHSAWAVKSKPLLVIQ